MIKLLLRWISLSVAVWVASVLLAEQVHIKGDWLTFAGIAFCFGLANATVGAVVRLFTLPLTFLTFGLWLIAVNALMLLLVDRFSDSMRVESFAWAVVAAVIISIVSAVINKVIDKVRN